jgi:hypothetical protein
VVRNANALHELGEVSGMGHRSLFNAWQRKTGCASCEGGWFVMVVSAGAKTTRKISMNLTLLYPLK